MFGESEAAATVLGKSASGYAGQGKDPYALPDSPMARFLLDQPGEDGDRLTLDVSRAQYEALELGRHGTVVWRGRKLIRFTRDAGTEAPGTGSGEAPAVREAEPEDVAPEGEAVVSGAAAPDAEVLCPWCGKPMGRWIMSSRDGFILVRETAEDAGAGLSLAAYLKEKWRQREKNRLRLTEPGCGRLLAHVCEDCQKAVVDYRDGACDYWGDGGGWF